LTRRASSEQLAADGKAGLPERLAPSTDRSLRTGVDGVPIREPDEPITVYAPVYATEGESVYRRRGGPAANPMVPDSRHFVVTFCRKTSYAGLDFPGLSEVEGSLREPEANGLD
jgi:hypothetical protein